MGRFTADPPILIREGIGINEIASSFDDNVEAIYNILDELVRKDYLSPEALKIANKIRDKKPTLKNMATTISRYGNFAIHAGNKVIDNQDRIASQI